MASAVKAVAVAAATRVCARRPSPRRRSAGRHERARYRSGRRDRGELTGQPVAVWTFVVCHLHDRFAYAVSRNDDHVSHDRVLRARAVFFSHPILCRPGTRFFFYLLLYLSYRVRRFYTLNFCFVTFFFLFYPLRRRFAINNIVAY